MKHCKHFFIIICILLTALTILPITALADESETVITPDQIQYADENGFPILTETGKGFNFRKEGYYDMDGWHFTYYTSRIRYTYHKDTKKWFPCDDGLYRNAEGYIVLASQHHEKGTILATPFGEGMVLDYCGTEGNIDIYTYY